MCKPEQNNDKKTKHVVICGGGPGGVMAALCLLGRNNNEDSSTPKYRVTLVDNRENYANVKKSDLSLHRSWMIGLSTHGIDSIHTIPGLWDEYVDNVGILVENFSLLLGEKELKFDKDDLGFHNYIVDRNHMVWALTNSLFDRYGKKNNVFTPLYNTKCLYVDDANKRILVRSSKTINNDKEKEFYLDYDVLIGADGFRSVVRSAFARSERYFECSMSDIFTRFKAIHVDLPEGFDPSTAYLFPDCVPNAEGIGLPETGQKINVFVKFYRHKECHPDLKSNDVDVVANHFKEHFKACKFVDYEDVANQWVNQSWNSTGQITCNIYHSTKMSALLLGDAAHATSPSLGMGMNTALADAVTLNQLLDTHKDNWNEVLPAYSKLRVKEGRSLTALAYYLFSMKPNQSLYYLIRGTIVSYIHMWLPSFIAQYFIEDPQALLGRGHLLSQVYNDATKLGVLSAIRKTNDTIRREWEEKEYGMVVVDEKNNQSLLMGIMFLVVAAAVAIAWIYPSLLNEVSSLGKIIQFMKQQ